MIVDPHKTRFANCNQGPRRGSQLVRMLRLCDLLRSEQSDLGQLATTLQVSQRTIRRDLNVLVLLGWVRATGTGWQWCKEPAIKEPGP